jgi:hypothetical protein
MSRFYIVHLDMAEHLPAGRHYTELLRETRTTATEARWADIQDGSIATYW